MHLCSSHSFPCSDAGFLRPIPGPKFSSFWLRSGPMPMHSPRQIAERNTWGTETDWVMQISLRRVASGQGRKGVTGSGVATLVQAGAVGPPRTCRTSTAMTTVKGDVSAPLALVRRPHLSVPRKRSEQCWVQVEICSRRAIGCTLEKCDRPAGRYFTPRNCVDLICGLPRPKAKARPGVCRDLMLHPAVAAARTAIECHFARLGHTREARMQHAAADGGAPQIADRGDAPNQRLHRRVGIVVSCHAGGAGSCVHVCAVIVRCCRAAWSAYSGAYESRITVVTVSRPFLVWSSHDSCLETKPSKTRDSLGKPMRVTALVCWSHGS